MATAPFHDRVARECSRNAAMLRELAERAYSSGLPDAGLLEAMAERLEALQYDALVEGFKETFGVPVHVDPDADTRPITPGEDDET